MFQVRTIQDAFTAIESLYEEVVTDKEDLQEELDEASIEIEKLENEIKEYRISSC